MDFRWNIANIEHIARHGIEPVEAQDVVEHAKPPYPRARPDDKYLIWGRTSAGRLLQVVFVLDPDATIYVIHARPLTAREKHQLARRKR